MNVLQSSSSSSFSKISVGGGFRFTRTRTRTTTIFVCLMMLVVGLIITGCSQRGSKVVVIYCSVDQMHAEPILKEFEKRTRIRVKAVYDSEAVKSVGLVNRLRAEAKNPQADVFWNNEPVRSV